MNNLYILYEKNNSFIVLLPFTKAKKKRALSRELFHCLKKCVIINIILENKVSQNARNKKKGSVWSAGNTQCQQSKFLFDLLHVAFVSVSELRLGNDCFLTWMPCNHICFLFYHGPAANHPPTPLILQKAIHNNSKILGSNVQTLSSSFLS